MINLNLIALYVPTQVILHWLYSIKWEND